MQSISIMTENVTDQKMGHIMKAGIIVPRITAPVPLVAMIVKILTYCLKIRLKNTSDNCPCASDKAQSLR